MPVNTRAAPFIARVLFTSGPQQQGKTRVDAAGHCVQCEASQEELEEHCQPVRWGEDPQLPLPCVCPAPLQAHPPLRHG